MQRYRIVEVTGGFTVVDRYTGRMTAKPLRSRPAAEARVAALGMGLADGRDMVPIVAAIVHCEADV